MSVCMVVCPNFKGFRHRHCRALDELGMPKWDTSVYLHPPSDLQARSVQLNFLWFCKMISLDT